MKNLIIIFLLGLYIPSSYSQIVKDSIFIRFDKSTDMIKEIKKGDLQFWLYNNLYKQELTQYKKDIKKYRRDTLPPPILFPAKPNPYYKFFTIGRLKLCNRLTSKDYKNGIFFNRERLKNLNPYKKLIF